MPQVFECEVGMHIRDSFDASGVKLFKVRDADARGVIESDIEANIWIDKVPRSGATQDASTNSGKFLVRSVSGQVSGIRA